MGTYKYDIPMPGEYKDLLLDIIDSFNKFKSLSGTYRREGDTVVVYPGRHSQNQMIKKEIPGSPIESFKFLGLLETIQYNDSLGSMSTASWETIVLTPFVYEWSNYQRKNKFKKWLQRHENLWKDLALGFSFVVSLGVAISELIKAIKGLPY